MLLTARVLRHCVLAALAISLTILSGCQGNQVVREPGHGPTVVLEYDAPPSSEHYSELTRQETVETLERLRRIRATLTKQGRYRGPIRHVWDRIRAGRQIAIDDNLRIEQQATYLLRDTSYITRVSRRAEPFIHFILEELERREMPPELALLPVIESAYRPNAVSKSNAVGLWQFIGPTSRFLGMKHNSWYDARRDVIAATHKALDYLAMLRDKFNGDWLLALAAYNGGHGTISRAMERNRRHGKPTDFWSLKLVNETRDYVPRFLAASLIYSQPADYGVELHPVANRPYFETVATGGQIDLNVARNLVDIDNQVFRALNAGFLKRLSAPKGPHRLLIPVSHSQDFRKALASLENQYRTHSGEHIVSAGDTLMRIALTYGTTVNQLQRINQLEDTVIRIGDRLTVPVSSRQVNAAIKTEFYTVKAGDTLWKIAKRHSISVDYLQQLNDLSDDSILQPGQKLRVRAVDKPLALNN